MIIDESFLNTYLYWGYIPSPKDPDIFQIPVQTISTPRIEEAGDILSSEIERCASNGKHNVLPMSGGLDSRLILCELLRFVAPKDISMLTFGVPGSYDYEIPGLISKQLGIELLRIDLREVPVTTQLLLDDISVTNEWTYLLDSFYNRIVFKHFGKDVNYWSGFMGNNLAGEHLGWYSGTSWKEACSTYIKHERRSVLVQLFSNDYNPQAYLKEVPDDSNVPYIDQLDFYHRQPKCILPILSAPDESYNQFFPLTAKSFMGYMMGLPEQYRINEVFYRSFVEERCKKIKDIPVKRTYCLPLRYEGSMRMKIKRYAVNLKRIITNGTTPMMNYYDFNNEFRNRRDLKTMIAENLNDLASRKIIPWINIESIAKEFFDNKAPIHDAVSTLASLELYLKYLNI